MAQPTTTQPPLAELGTVADINNPGPYSFGGLQYPLDVASSSYQGHYINFFINAHNSSKLPGGSKVGGSGSSPTSSAAGALINSNYSRINKAISIYIPDTMQTSQNIQWENASLYEMGGQVLKGVGAAAGIFKSGTENMMGGALNALKNVAAAAEAGMGAFGFALNPQLLAIFRGIDFRTFQYEFYFAPKNSQEAQAVRDIIYTFRFHAHPEVSGDYGVFFTAPSTFDIEFMFRGKRNINVHQVKTCVLKQYSVDYAPYGWSTYIDGMPVQTRLVLQFQETDIIARQDVQKGY